MRFEAPQRGTAAVETLRRVEIFDDTSLKGRDFCTAYTAAVDAWLARIFTAALLEEPGDASAGPALVALGGHGRGELCPQSDLDLLLLIPDKFAAEGLAQKIWYPIWDSGVKLGHSVRTMRATLALASDDLDTATALLSARHLAGDESLTQNLIEKARSAWRRNGRSWLGVLSESVAARHSRDGEVAFTLEPDLKEGKGGLRDVHALTWAAMAGAAIDSEVFTGIQAEYDTILAARVELHRATQRGGDRLLLQEQTEVARRLDLESGDDLMAQICAASRSIAWASDEAWFDIDSAASAAASPRGRRLAWIAGSDSNDQTLESGIVLRRGRVALAEDFAAVTDPLTVLRVARQAARRSTRIAAETLQAMALVPAPSEPWSEATRTLFCDLLLSGDGLIDVVEALDRAGIWERFVHEWTNVRGKVQRNALHRFTVDRHLLVTVANSAEVADRVARPDLLALAALLHDIGKGYSGDHSITGELLAAGVARRMGFTPGDVATVGFLVRSHLLLSDTARRRDLGDPATIRHVADTVGSIDRLTLLHALAEADGRATGPQGWTSWTATLVERLVVSVGDLLIQREVESGAPAHLSVTGSETHSLHSSTPRGDIGLRSAPVPSVIGDGEWVVVVSEDRPGVLCRCAGTLALHGLDVVEATAEFDGDVVIDRFRVQTPATGATKWDKVAEDIELALTGRLAIRARLTEREQSRRRRFEPGLSQLDPGVRFDDEMATGATMIEVVGRDRAGLLYELTRAFGELDVDIRSAKIHTLGVDVIDTFYVTDSAGRPITDQNYRREIRRSLHHVLHSIS